MASNADRVQKVLDFLNGVQAAEEIVQRVEDDPEHGSPSEEAVGVPLWVAQEILDARSKLPNQRFESLAQVEAVRGLGEDTLHDIFRTVNPDSPPSPESTQSSSEPTPRGIPGDWRMWLTQSAIIMIAVWVGSILSDGSGGEGGPTISNDESSDQGPGVVQSDQGPGVVQLDPRFYSYLDTLAANSDEALRLLAVALGGLPETLVVRVPGELDPSFNLFLDTLLSRWPPPPPESRVAGPLAFGHEILIQQVDSTTIQATCTMEGVLVSRIETATGASR